MNQRFDMISFGRMGLNHEGKTATHCCEEVKHTQASSMFNDCTGHRSALAPFYDVKLKHLVGNFYSLLTRCPSAQFTGRLTAKSPAIFCS